MSHSKAELTPGDADLDKKQVADQMGPSEPAGEDEPLSDQLPCLDRPDPPMHHVLRPHSLLRFLRSAADGRSHLNLIGHTVRCGCEQKDSPAASKASNADVLAAPLHCCTRYRASPCIAPLVEVETKVISDRASAQTALTGYERPLECSKVPCWGCVWG